MIYDRGPTIGDGQWHCPFSLEWVERMRRAAKHCELLTAEQIKFSYERIDSGCYYEVPPGDFLSEPQDARGLPLSWCREEEQRYMKYTSCCATYDYKSIPDVVITNGREDWPLTMWKQNIKT